LIAQWLSDRLGQQFIVENRPGAGSNLGTATVIRSAPDGYTLLLVGPPAAINATLYEKLSFNFLHDIAPIAGIVRFPNVMVVHPSVPVTTVAELIADAKANPGKINFASTGLGSTPHVNGELFKMMAGINIVHVPYRSAAAAMTDLLSGQMQLYLGTAATTVGYSGLADGAAPTGPASIRLDVGVLGHLFPHAELNLDECSQLLRRAGKSLKPHVLEPRLNVRAVDDFA
jgi:tripartite-type tricarboxylate transporter receptor subunit TctC